MTFVSILAIGFLFSCYNRENSIFQYIWLAFGYLLGKMEWEGKCLKHKAILR